MTPAPNLRELTQRPARTLDVPDLTDRNKRPFAMPTTLNSMIEHARELVNPKRLTGESSTNQGRASQPVCHHPRVSAPLLIVDGDNLAHRAYHSMPEGHGNAVRGFFSILQRIEREEQPRAVVVAWDTLGHDTFRSELWPPYQAGRVFPADLVEQLENLPQLCRGFGVGVQKAAGYEADDLIAGAVREETQAGGRCLVMTTDRDAFQLVSERTTVLVPKPRTRELARFGPVQVVAELGVLPEQVPCFKALCGDASDNIPGIKGIGPKKAAALLLAHGTLDAVVAEWPAERAELALRFREVVRMRPFLAEPLPMQRPEWDRDT